MQTMSFQNIGRPVFIWGDRHFQKPQIHPAHHGQESMSGRTLQWFMVVKIVPKLLGFFVVFFATGILTGELGILFKKLTQFATEWRIFVDPFGDDVARTLQGIRFGSHGIAQKIAHFLHRPGVALIVKQLRQGFQAFFSGHIGTGFSSRFVRQIQILQGLHIRSLRDLLVQLGGHLALFLNLGYHIFAALFQGLGFFCSVFDFTHLHLVQIASSLFAIP